jgi:hypothetical protein
MKRPSTFTRNILYGFIALLSAVSISEAQTQDELPINLQTALELGGANNITIREFTRHQELAVAR